MEARRSGNILSMRRAAFTLLLLAGFSAHAELYRWTDSSGRTHVTDTPPPAGAKDVKKRASAAPAAAPAAEPFALQQARRDYPVTLYSTPSCEGCVQARKLLNARGIPFAEKTVQTAEALEELKKTSGSDGVPVLLVGTDVVKGYEEGAYTRALDAAGYPKAGILPPRSQGEPAAPTGAKPAADAAPEKTPEEAPRGPYAPRPPRTK
jgi:glutaredoxin